MCIFIFFVLQMYFLVPDPDPQKVWKKCFTLTCMTPLMSKEIAFEEIVQDLWFVFHFLSLLLTM